MVRSLAVLAGMWLAGCTYTASFQDCEVTCHGPAECPANFTCGDEGRCRLGDHLASCVSVLGDAHLAHDSSATDASTTDGGNLRCTGTAMPCSQLSASTCSTQTGCSYVTPSCIYAIDCTLIATSTMCMAADGCYVDFTEPYCKPTAGYCSGATKSQCESKVDCDYAGGCSGTAQTCTLFTSQTACSAQLGCAWN